MDDHIVARLDRRVGNRGRSAFIAESVKRALDDDARWEEILAALGSLEDSAHDWDEDPEGWVRRQRESDPSRVG